VGVKPSRVITPGAVTAKRPPETLGGGDVAGTALVDSRFGVFITARYGKPICWRAP